MIRSGPEPRRLRVLIIQPWIRVGGAELLSLYLAEELERRGHRAPIAALFVDPEGLPELTLRRRYHLPPSWLADRFRRSRALTYLLGPLVLLAVAARAARDVDLLNPHNVPAPFVAAAVARLRGLPVVWQLNEVPAALPADHARRLPLLERVAWRAAGWLARLVAGAPAAIVVLDEKTRRATYAAYGREAVVAWPGVDVATFASDGEPARPPPLRLLFVGKLHPQKDPSRPLRVVARLAGRGVDAQLTIIGEGPLRQELHAEAARLAVADRVRFRGLVSLPELRRLYRESHVLLVTATGHQAWGLTPFEALASGTPAVVSEEIGAAEVLAARQAALVVPPTDEAFADAVERLMLDGALRERLVANGRRLLREELTWSNFAERCLEVFTRALERRHR